MTDLSTAAFTSDRLSLRAMTPADAPEAFAAATAAIARFMSWEPFPALDALVAACREWVPRMQSGSDLALVLRLRTTGEFLGIAGVHHIGGSEVELGIWVKEAAHRRGYGREAIAAITAWARDHIGANAFIYPVVEQNHPSRRLAESLGGVAAGGRVLKKASGAEFSQVVYRIPTPPKE